ncbi:hypothetical protein [Halobacterium yunchengense]|uniref:hypothetical protein n=1 Tax=Halobacterium yunchengense TaxID=3108497 RepID=UPI00300A5994
MKGNVEYSELEEKTPFTESLRGRVIPTGFIYAPGENEELPDFTEDEDWVSFIPSPDGELHFLSAEPISGVYFGKEPEDPDSDLNIPFLELYYQRLSWPDIAGLFTNILDDIRNLAASLSKLAVFQRTLSESTVGLQRLIQSELEYIFMVSRSMYDHLQFVAGNTWDKVVPTREGDDFSASLPTSSFKDIALNGGEPVPADTLQSKYGFPEGLAEFYSNEAEEFKKIRNFRDEVAHQGNSPDAIFQTENGLAVDVESNPYSRFDIWKDNQVDENNLAPLWPFVAHIVDHTISALDRFVSGLLDKPLHLPHELAEGYNVYLRGPHIPNIDQTENLKMEDEWGEEFIETVEGQI